MGKTYNYPLLPKPRKAPPAQDVAPETEPRGPRDGLL